MIQSDNATIRYYLVTNQPIDNHQPMMIINQIGNNQHLYIFSQRQFQDPKLDVPCNAVCG